MTVPFEALGTQYIKCCATCKHWQPSPHETRGYCEQVAATANGLRLTSGMMTLDLAICSRWEEKEDAE